MMGQNALATVARYKPANLVILVFDNGHCLTTGCTGTTATSTGTDIELIAKGAGIAHTATVREVGETWQILGHAFREAGPWLIVAEIDTSDRERFKDFKPLPTDCYESGQRFRAALKLGAPNARIETPPAG
jgi:thiamine pyrophosphate-dependent acetolactate synthase large subunit-like protein